MKIRILAFTAALLAAATPAQAQDHAAIVQEITSLRSEVRALRTAIERQRRPALVVTNANMEYVGAGKPAADRAAERACRDHGYDTGVAQNFIPRRSGMRDGPFLTAYVCSDRPRT